MGFFSNMAREVRFLGHLLRTLKGVDSISHTSSRLAVDDLEESVDKHADRLAIVAEDKTLTYRDLDHLANRYAHWAQGRGLKRGDVVAVLLPNRADYVPIWMGLNKIGVTAALINNALTGNSLAHCLHISTTQNCIGDLTTIGAFDDVKGTLSRPIQFWCLDLDPTHETSDHRALDPLIARQDTDRPSHTIREGMTAGDVALYIYTSGTTGLPKAAKMTIARVQLYMRGFACSTNAKPSDRIYIVLPLYHATGGLCGVGAALMSGAAIILKRKFSASQFWSDIHQQGCTMFTYIGELCRYLVNSPIHSLERAHKIRLVVGNGLRPDVWNVFQKRFNIPYILEFYGSTEGNVSMLNFDSKPGAIGRVPGYIRSKFNIRIVKFDVETEMPVRDASGLCLEAKTGEIGETIGEIAGTARTTYSGYADEDATRKKVLRDVFKKGDMWFRTGDLMRQDEEGYFYFVDRIGDTFRWKGENVSTTEVAEHLASAPGVLEVNVYGVSVPGADGKAGMVSVVVGEGFDINTFKAHVDQSLPGYARPLFVRLQHDLETTGTFKYRKIDLVKAGFDPATVSDPLYVRLVSGDYTPLTPDLYQEIQSGQFRF